MGAFIDWMFGDHTNRVCLYDLLFKHKMCFIAMTIVMQETGLGRGRMPGCGLFVFVLWVHLHRLWSTHVRWKLELKKSFINKLDHFYDSRFTSCWKLFLTPWVVWAHLHFFCRSLVSKHWSISFMTLLVWCFFTRIELFISHYSFLFHSHLFDSL